MPDADSQHDHAVRLDLSYRLTFAVPSFEVASRLVDLAGRFHAGLSPAYPIDASAMRALPGTTFADVGIEGRLAIGDQRFTVRPTGFDADIRNIQPSHTRDYAERFIGACRSILDDVVPRADGDTCTIGLATWLKLRGGSQRAHSLLDAQRPAAATRLADRGQRVLAGIDLRAFVDDAGYEWQLRCEPSAVEGAHLFLWFTWNARGQLATTSVQTQAATVEREFRAIAAAVGLEFAA